jgi:phage terminase large subunit GpA-like protein
MDLLVEIDVPCPHCGEVFPLQIDTSQGEHTMIEDCSVCCRPITLQLECRPGEVISAREED